MLEIFTKAAGGITAGEKRGQQRDEEYMLNQTVHLPCLL